jgi:hypothetical protein
MTASNSALRWLLQGHSSTFYDAEVAWDILYVYTSLKQLIIMKKLISPNISDQLMKDETGIACNMHTGT